MSRNYYEDLSEVPMKCTSVLARLAKEGPLGYDQLNLEYGIEYIEMYRLSKFVYFVTYEENIHVRTIWDLRPHYKIEVLLRYG